ncbi:MAG: peptidase S41 [Alphaproteobacteria bacterium]|nr:MAG: peptidase S41 [Alphaproteobacteria bacterium]
MRLDVIRVKGRLSAAAGLLVLLALPACVTGPEANRPADGYASDRAMFVTGYEDIESIYIEPVDIGSLAMAGLQQLATIDPAITVEREGRSVSLAVNGTRRSFEAPAPDQPTRWGVLTAGALAAAREASPALAETPAEDVYVTMFDGIIGRLDDFSRYSSAAEAAENRASRDGFGGIGVTIAVEEEGVRVLKVMHYTPAERAGLRADDYITEIDGTPVAGLDQHQVITKLRGAVDSKVLLKVTRTADPEPRLVSVVRAHVVPETVSYRREGKVAYLRVFGFNSETAASLRREIKSAEEEIGPGLAGYILDLRGNPGGLLDQAVAVADLFLESGRIVSTRGRHPDSHQYFEAVPGDIGSGKPIAILINGNSASASEIVAAALQDDGRAVVIGSNSYGKGTVQTVIRMPNDGELTLTWARFHAPTGYTLNHLGVLPTICTSAGPGGADSDRVLADLDAGRLKPVPTSSRNSVDPADTAALDQLRAGCPQRRTEDGLDLVLALQLLKHPSLYARAVHLADTPGFTASTQPTVSQAPQ